MLTINQAVHQIVAAPAPVLFPDTCALLDLIRLPYRESHPQVVRRTLDAVQELLAMQDNSRLWVVIPAHVDLEFSEHRDGILEELKGHWKKLDQHVEVALALGTMAGVALPSSISYEHSPLTTYLETLPSNFFDKGLILDTDSDCVVKAHYRMIQRVPPAQKGKTNGDCLIIEHCIEVVRQLRQAGFQEKSVFMTTNTNDYCENRSTPKVPLGTELQALDIDLTTKWEWTKSLLTPRL